MPFQDLECTKKLNLVYFMIQSTIANIYRDIVLLELLLGSRDQQTSATSFFLMFFAQIP